MHGVVRGVELTFTPDPEVPGLSAAPLVGAATGSVHIDQELCRLEAGRPSRPSFTAFEESWYVLEGSGLAHAFYFPSDWEEPR